MNDISELKNAINERFKLDAYITQYEREINSRAERFISEKYKGSRIKRDGSNYILTGVHVGGRSYTSDIALPDVEISLFFTITDKIKTKQNERLKSEIVRFSRHGHCLYYGGKKELWIILNYKVSIEKAFKKEINLEIS